MRCPAGGASHYTPPAPPGAPGGEGIARAVCAGAQLCPSTSPGLRLARAGLCRRPPSLHPRYIYSSGEGRGKQALRPVAVPYRGCEGERVNRVNQSSKHQPYKRKRGRILPAPLINPANPLGCPCHSLERGEAPGAGCLRPRRAGAQLCSRTPGEYGEDGKACPSYQGPLRPWRG